MLAVAATFSVVLGSACLYFVMEFLLLAPFILKFVSMELLDSKVQWCCDCIPQAHVILSLHLPRAAVLLFFLPLFIATEVWSVSVMSTVTDDVCRFQWELELWRKSLGKSYSGNDIWEITAHHLCISCYVLVPFCDLDFLKRIHLLVIPKCMVSGAFNYKSFYSAFYSILYFKSFLSRPVSQLIYALYVSLVWLQRWLPVCNYSHHISTH